MVMSLTRIYYKQRYSNKKTKKQEQE